MRLLALDTALGACQAALLDGDAVLASRSERMARGHQERLAPMVAELMAEAGASFPSLARVAVTVGPGSFTGLRVGLAFAKGLGVALDVPVLGLGVLPVLALAEPCEGPHAAAIDAGRGRVHLQLFTGTEAAAPAEQLDVATAVERLRRAGALRIAGPGAPLLADAGAVLDLVDAPDIAAAARIAARLAPEDAPPRPLYGRAPDALTLAERRAAAAA